MAYEREKRRCGLCSKLLPNGHPFQYCAACSRKLEAGVSPGDIMTGKAKDRRVGDASGMSEKQEARMNLIKEWLKDPRLNFVSRVKLRAELKELERASTRRVGDAEGDYEVVWTDRSYKDHHKVFRNDSQGTPNNGEAKARAFAKKLDNDDAKNKYGNIRGRISVRALDARRAAAHRALDSILDWAKVKDSLFE